MGKNKSQKNLDKRRKLKNFFGSNTKNVKPEENNAGNKHHQEFLETIRFSPDSKLQEQPIEESEFVRKVRELTKGFTKEPKDIMIMYSESKKTDKMTLEEFLKYEMLQRALANSLKQNSNNTKKAYMDTLSRYPEQSDEAIILKGLIDEISKTQER